MADFRVTVCGGGIAGVEAMLRLRRLAGDRIDLTLISPAEQLIYRPTTVLEPFTGEPARHYPIERIVADTGASWIRDSLTWVDRAHRTVHTAGGEQADYDALLLAVGALERAPSAHVALFTSHDGGELYRGVIAGIESGQIRRLAFVLPAGPVWPLPLYELALLTAQRARDRDRTLELSFFIPDPRPLEALGEEASGVVAGLLAEAGIKLYAGSEVDVVSRDSLRLRSNGTVLRADRIISVPVIGGPNVRGIPGFGRDRFLHVDEFCRVLDTDGRIFGAGDATDLPIKQGGIGTQQADVASAGIVHLAGAGPQAEPLRPRINAMMLTGRAPLYLSAYLIGGLGWRAKFYTEPPWPDDEKLIAEELGPYLRTLHNPPAST